ncbi:hypothetical protein DFS33DRAFT_1276864 [Desarmillaria ectypa]|nr:hypothetical protein DFS33DRAFT_1276864 [Desarmillaria ectypa]
MTVSSLFLSREGESIFDVTATAETALDPRLNEAIRMKLRTETERCKIVTSCARSSSTPSACLQRACHLGCREKEDGHNELLRKQTAYAMANQPATKTYLRRSSRLNETCVVKVSDQRGTPAAYRYHEQDVAGKPVSQIARLHQLGWDRGGGQIGSLRSGTMELWHQKKPKIVQKIVSAFKKTTYTQTSGSLIGRHQDEVTHGVRQGNSGARSRQHPSLDLTEPAHRQPEHLTSHPRSLNPIKTELGVQSMLIKTLASSRACGSVAGYTSRKCKIHLADICDNIKYILNSFNVFAGITQPLD